MARLVAAVTGSSGLIGSSLVPALEHDGFEVRRLVRRTPRGPNEVEWNPAAGAINRRAFDGVTAVVHLSGENVGHRWTAARRARIRASRVSTTALIARTLADSDIVPEVVINAAAVGIYGDRGDELLDEESSSGSGFLADVCREWEAAAAPISERGIRLVLARAGVVMTTHGGALRRLLLPFRLGVGGRLGDGRQWMSWITLEDHIRAIIHAIREPAARGPINFTAPEPVTNADLTRAVARALRRPAFMQVPAFALKLVFGDMAEETLLASQRALPRKLTAIGFQHRSPSFETAMARMLGPDRVSR